MQKAFKLNNADIANCDNIETHNSKYLDFFLLGIVCGLRGLLLFRLQPSPLRHVSARVKKHIFIIADRKLEIQHENTSRDVSGKYKLKQHGELAGEDHHQVKLQLQHKGQLLNKYENTNREHCTYAELLLTAAVRPPMASFLGVWTGQT